VTHSPARALPTGLTDESRLDAASRAKDSETPARTDEAAEAAAGEAERQDSEKPRGQPLDDPSATPPAQGHGAVIAGIAAAVFAGLALVGNTGDLAGLLLIGLGLGLTLAIARLYQRASFSDPMFVVGGIATLVFIALFATVNRPGEEDQEPTPPRTVTVSNEVTDGPNAMREDTALKLFYAPRLCQSDDCVVPRTALHTGNKISDVVCQVVGGRMTNGNDHSASDDRNPELFESRVWYGVRTRTGRLAYFSEVWADPSQRGGLGLPDCSSASIDQP
jgi:hypothetical protein